MFLNQGLVGISNENLSNLRRYKSEEDWGISGADYRIIGMLKGQKGLFGERHRPSFVIETVIKEPTMIPASETAIVLLSV